jgi:hypothetical protein
VTTLKPLALTLAVGLAAAVPAQAKGSGHAGSGFSASADAASLARIRDQRPIGSKPQPALPQDSVLRGLMKDPPPQKSQK